MAQSDQVVQNATFPSVRADINDNLAALYSQSSGNSAPTVTVAFQPWVDTSSSPPVWKVRNGSNSAWITVGVLDPAGFNAGGITAIANGGTGATTATAALAALLPSQSGNAGKALITSGSAATWTSLITLGTAVASTSGTSIDFTGIPSWAKRISVLMRGVSTNGASSVMIQLGTSSGIEATGYSGTVDFVEDNAAGTTFSTGFLVDRALAATDLRTGKMIIEAFDSNIWNEQSTFSNNLTALLLGAGDKALSGTLDRIRITTVNGTDTFDAGSINILYEG
jgi:hypothetical protein